MNWLDKTISWLSPRWGLQRVADRAALQEIQNSAERDRGNWYPANGTAEAVNSRDRDIARYRARDLERNNDMVESIVAGIERNVVGRGFQVQARVPTTDDSDAMDEAVNRQIEKAWKKWRRARNCDITGQSSFNEILRMVLRRRLYDGEIFIVKVFDRNARIPFKLQLKEADELDTGRIWGDNNNQVINGVEVDSNFKPLGYWFYKTSPDGFRSLESTRVSADRVIHIFRKDRPTQVRGISEIGRAMERMRDTGEYLEAERVKARIAACLAVIVQTNDPTSRLRNMSKDTSTGQRIDSISPGMWEYLRPGETVSVVNPGNIPTNAREFVQLNQRLAGGGMGISYELAARDYSQVNFSSARQGLLEDQKTFQMIQDYMIEHFCMEVYTTFLQSAVLSGEINLPDFFDKGRINERYLEHEWITPGWSWIDPLKEANASEKEITLGINTRARIAASMGRDWQDDLKQLAREQEYAKSLGLNFNQGGVNNEVLVDDEKREEE